MATSLKARISFSYHGLFLDKPLPKNLHHCTTFFISMDKKLNWFLFFGLIVQRRVLMQILMLQAVRHLHIGPFAIFKSFQGPLPKVKHFPCLEGKKQRIQAHSRNSRPMGTAWNSPKQGSILVLRITKSTSVSCLSKFSLFWHWRTTCQDQTGFIGHHFL